jgi:hypothetical protein
MAGERIYKVANFVAPTTAAPVEQPTGTAIRTMLQIATSATMGIKIVEWGISFDGFAAAAPIQVEFFGTTVAATMSTALAAADVDRMSDPLGTETIPLQYGTALTAFATGAVGEGTVANYRSFDVQQIAPTGQYVKQWPLGREPSCALSTFARIRVTAAASVNCYCYVDFAPC